MMTSNYRVRFATDKKYSFVAESTELRKPQERDLPNQRRKSRSGCRECKNRRVKCDETFPVCLRCQRRGVVCRSVPRSAQWLIEVPWLNVGGSLPNISPNVNYRLLQYWFEKASQIMVINPDINPLSFPILQHLESSKSLLHSLQSISIAHENYFSSSSLISCLQERDRALTLFQEELQKKDQSPQSSFLTMLMLGMSSAWIDQENKSDFGKPHLRGARAVIDTMIAEPDAISDPFVQLAVGCYIYWDQASAFLLHPQEQTALNTPEIYRCVLAMHNVYHPIVGHSIEIFYLLANLGRYCRNVMEYGIRDLALETTFEEQLLTWNSPEEDHNLYLLSDAFRKHGLIMLYRTIASGNEEPIVDFADINSQSSSNTFEEVDHESSIRQYATEILANIMAIPNGCSYHMILALPLLTAGSELGEEDTDLRDEVRKRFRALFSLNRIHANLFAIEMLEELWTLRAANSTISPFELMLQKNWNLLLL